MVRKPKTLGAALMMYHPADIDLLNGGLASPCRKVVIGYMQLLITSELPPYSHCTLMTLPPLVEKNIGLSSDCNLQIIIHTATFQTSSTNLELVLDSWLSRVTCCEGGTPLLLCSATNMPRTDRGRFCSSFYKSEPHSVN